MNSEDELPAFNERYVRLRVIFFFLEHVLAFIPFKMLAFVLAIKYILGFLYNKDFEDFQTPVLIPISFPH